MYTIIDVIGTYPHADGILKEYPDSKLIILDYDEVNEVEDLKGSTVTIIRADGSEIHKKVLLSESRHGTVGIYLASTTKEEVPRLSKITWT